MTIFDTGVKGKHYFDITFDRDLTHIKNSTDLMWGKGIFDTSQSHILLYLCHPFDKCQRHITFDQNQR